MGLAELEHEAKTATHRSMPDAMGTLTIAANERKLCAPPPDVLICLTIPPRVGMFAGYQRVTEMIACGERAKVALPQIQKHLRPHWHWPAQGLTRLTRRMTGVAAAISGESVSPNRAAS